MGNQERNCTLAISLSLLLFGCAETPGVESSPSKTNGQSVDQNKQDQANEVPADFPLALYPGAKVARITKEPLPTGIVQTNVFTEIEGNHDGLRAIGAYYADKLKSAKWILDEPDVHLQNDDFFQVIAHKGNDIAQVNAHRRDDSNVTCIDLTRLVSPGPAAP